VLVWRHWPRALVAFAATGAALLSATRAPDVGAVEAARPVGAVHVRILGINDLHGHLDPTAVGGRRAGGVAWLSSGLDAHSRGVPTIRVTAGDSPGASPLISAHFHDRPTVEALALMHFDVGTVGNHDFDEGPDEMQRLVDAAGFPYVAANVLDAKSGRPLLEPFVVVDRGGVKVGFIGVTTPSSARWLMPEYAQRLRFADISDTVNRYAGELEAQGVHAIVVLAHAGGVQESDSTGSGEIVDETRQMRGAVDAVIAGHTHTLMNLRVGGKLVTQAVAFGTAFDQLDLWIDPRSDEVVDSSAEVHRTWDDEVAPDPRVSAMVERYRTALGDLATRPVMFAAEPITRSAGPNGPNELGWLVAESQRRAAHADVAFVPPDWVRSDLPAGPLTYADLFEAQPFGNDVVRMRMSGRDLQAVIDEQQRPGQPELVSAGLPAAIEPNRSYVVAASSFLAAGGEGFKAFTRATRRETIGKDIDALVTLLAQRFPASA
jgi:5'-nucleotidase